MVVVAAVVVVLLNSPERRFWARGPGPPFCEADGKEGGEKGAGGGGGGAGCMARDDIFI